VTYILKVFNEATASGPADIIFVYNLSPHVLSKSRVTVTTASLVLPAGSGKEVANGDTYTASLMYPQKKKIKGSKVRRTRWPSDRPAPANPFLWKLAI
jgi:hypothetical protein